jgi:hypothetical protein
MLPLIFLLGGELQCCKLSYIYFLMQTCDHEFGSKGWLLEIELLIPKKVQKAHLNCLHRKNPTYYNVVTSFLVKLVPTCTSHIKGTANQSTTYFLLVFPTQRIKSLAQKQNLWKIYIQTLWSHTITCHNMEQVCHMTFAKLISASLHYKVMNIGGHHSILQTLST